jgi:hypothetical protein
MRKRTEGRWSIYSLSRGMIVGYFWILGSLGQKCPRRQALRIIDKGPCMRPFLEPLFGPLLVDPRRSSPISRRPVPLSRLIGCACTSNGELRGPRRAFLLALYFFVLSIVPNHQQVPPSF